MDPVQEFFQNQSDMNASGTLTLGKAMIGRFYRILEGEHANRVVIKAGDNIGGQEIVRFANGFTWTFVHKLKDVRCEAVFPIFTEATHQVDFSQSTWYPDGSDQPMHYMW